ncbi:MAG: hypothetical protein ACQPRH_05915 [Solitalea-like symbiont of Tyrophagus putrescentiae]
MKKLVLILGILSFSFLSCKEETALNTKDSTRSDNQYITHNDYKISGPYIIYNPCAIKGNIMLQTYITPANNEKMALIWENFYPSNTWYIQDLRNGAVKLWANKKEELEHQRVLDINSMNPNKDGSIDAVLSTLNDGSNEQWDLIGTKTRNVYGYISRFRGVIINRRTAQMLELVQHPNSPDRYLIAGRVFYDSEEGKHFKEHDNFDDDCNGEDITTIWNIRLASGDLL